MILFDEYYQKIYKFCLNALKNFKKEKAETTISTFAIYCNPFSGVITINFDTAYNSENLVKYHQTHDSIWYGEDNAGTFNDNCPDFEFSDFARLEIPEWENEFEKNGIINIKYRLVKRQIDLSKVNDEVINKVFFDFLKGIFDQVLTDKVIYELKKSKPFRVGIQIANSEDFLQYWLFNH
ncbi:MAG: hypothetical protein ACOX2X_03880 [Peptococcia bacterium]|jgi:hypothetical protein